MRKILCVDPGDVRIGIAVSDCTRTLARPLGIIKHVSRSVDAEQIAAIAQQQDVDIIVIGQSRDDHGEPTIQGRKASRLAEQIAAVGGWKVVLWDEYESSQRANQTLNRSIDRKHKKRVYIDDRAAAIILQDFLDRMNAGDEFYGGSI